MKYCQRCGAMLDDEALFCSKCGSSTDPIKQMNDYNNYNNQNNSQNRSNTNDTLKLIAKVFLVLGCVALGFSIIPLCWCIPMTTYYFRMVKENRQVSVAFKVCTLIFVSPIAGILMLCDNN